MNPYGYHGTSRENWQAIQEEGFRFSHNRFDWLGDGIYFFQDAPSRAQRWAREAHGEDAVVIGAEIDIAGCMDLLVPDWFAILGDAYDAVVEHHRRTGLRLPRQDGLAHGMDRAVINHLVGVLAESGVTIRSVRGAFREGRPAFPGSGLYDLAHVQIAVLDTKAIGRVTEYVGEGRA